MTQTRHVLLFLGKQTTTFLEPQCFWTGTLSGLSCAVPWRLFAHVRLLSAVTAESDNTRIPKFPLPSSQGANSLTQQEMAQIGGCSSTRVGAIVRPTTCYTNDGMPVKVRFLSSASIFSHRAGGPHTVPLSSFFVERSCSQLDRH
jgi:hypothetical protein